MVDNSLAKPATRRWIKFALIISLGLNLGIAGVLIGTALRAPEARRSNVEAPEGVAMLARAMPQSHQRELRESLRVQRDDLQPDRQELKNLRENFVEALRAEPFDIDVVRQAFAAQRRILDQVTTAGHAAVIDQIAKMSAQERDLYIRRLLSGSRGPSNRTPPPRQ